MKDNYSSSQAYDRQVQHARAYRAEEINRRRMASNRQPHSRQRQIPPVLKWPLITLYLILATVLIVAVIKWAE